MKTSPEIMVKLYSLGLRGILTPLRVKIATKIISKQHREAASTGDMNQLITILYN